MDLNWENPGRREVATTATFIDSEAHKIHDGFGGSSKLDLERGEYVQFRPYLQLERALKIYIGTVLGIRVQGDSWDGLCEKINHTEDRYSNRKEGFWHSIWYKMGDYSSMLDGWVALIPDAYGLAVVKTGLAVVFKLAEHSAEKRKKIFDTFAELRDALMRADPTRTSFRANKEVASCAEHLYQTVVDSIEDMILLTSQEKSTWRRRIPKFKYKTPAPNPDTILQNVADRTKEFERAVGMARDQAIEGTAVVSQDTNIRTTMIQWDVSATKNNTEILRSDIEKSGVRLESVGGEVSEVHGLVSQISSGMEHMTTETTGLRKEIDENTTSMKKERENNERRHQELYNLIVGQVEAKSKIAKRESALEDGSLSLKNQLMTLLFEGKKKDAEIAMLKERLNHNRKRGAVVSLNRFCEILAQPSSTEDEPVDIERMFQHPNEDFRRALVHKSRFNAATQGQVQSLLRHERLHRWVTHHHPDLILVDANINSSGLSKVSAISVFCATLVSSMIEVHPDEVVVQFFCGLHTAPLDPWHGPNGLVRSIVMQLLMRLVKMNIVDLGFINNRDYLRDLEEHDLNALCDTLYSLVSLFPADTRVYCIIDSISWFDKDKTFAELVTVMEWLKCMVEDRSLIPIFKIMLTNPMKSNRRMKELPVFRENPSRLVTLSSRNLIPMGISNRAIERQLSRSPSPSPLTPKKGVSRTARPESYDDDYGDW